MQRTAAPQPSQQKIIWSKIMLCLISLLQAFEFPPPNLSRRLGPSAQGVILSTERELEHFDTRSIVKKDSHLMPNDR